MVAYYYLNTLKRKLVQNESNTIFKISNNFNSVVKNETQMSWKYNYHLTLMLEIRVKVPLVTANSIAAIDTREGR